MKKIEFEAIPSGDHECFTFAVNKETYIIITGVTSEKEIERNKNHFHEGLYNIYPNSIFNHKIDYNNLENHKPNKKINIKIEIEEI